MHGPTTVGDFKSDPQLMARLGATLTGVGVRELAVSISMFFITSKLYSTDDELRQDLAGD